MEALRPQIQVAQEQLERAFDNTDLENTTRIFKIGDQLQVLYMCERCINAKISGARHQNGYKRRVNIACRLTDVDPMEIYHNTPWNQRPTCTSHKLHTLKHSR